MNELLPLIHRHADAHGASATVVNGLWALAHLAAVLICAKGVDAEQARKGFLAALDLAIKFNGVDGEQRVQ